MLIHPITLLPLVISIVHSQLTELTSPCPDQFIYNARNPDEPDRWYGVLTVGTDDDLEGVWLKITLDRKAELLGNWFSEAVSKDNIQFSIRNPQYKLEVGKPLLIKFFVKYNAGGVVPTVKKILLNGKTICPSNSKSAVEEPTLHISVGEDSHKHRDDGSSSSNNFNSNKYENQRTTTSTKPPITNRPYIQSTTTGSSVKRPLSNEGSDSDVSSEEFFQGDYVDKIIYKRPASRPLSSSGGSSRNDVKCGTVAQRPSPLISHGQEASPGQWPWHVALYVTKGPELKYTCGGTLISDRHVVTAAHCVTKPRTNTPVRKEKFAVYVGKYNLINFGNEVQNRDIEWILVHPDYNASVYFNDIAILKLDSPVEINDYVRPCCLWEGRDTNLENVVGELGTVVGWGFNEEGQLSRNLMQAQLPIVTTTTCLLSNRNFFSQFIYDKNFCAGFRNDTSVCNGDSGGGMVIPRPGTSGQNTVWQLRGIVSLGVARQSEAICDPKQYSILTDAAKYVPWIKENLKD